MNIDFTKENLSYIYGLFLADGYLTENTRNRGKLGIELSEKDADIIPKIKKELKDFNSSIIKRARSTNFKNNYNSIGLYFFSLELRNQIKMQGFPSGKKSKLTKPPKFENVSFWRGYFDGDGSLGITSKGYPFLSLVTISPYIADAWILFLYKIINKQKTTSPNKRDGAYNICVYKEDAQKVAQILYTNASLYLNRKYKKHEKISKWQRPTTMIKRQ